MGKSTLAHQCSQLSPVIQNITEEAVTCPGPFLYVGLSTGQILKIDVSTFSVVDSLSLGSPVACLITDGNYLYAGLLFSPEASQITKIDLATFSVVETLTLASGEYNIERFAISGNYLYSCHDSSPGIIVKVDLTTFTRIGAINTIVAGVHDICVSGNFLYGAVYFIPSSQVVKIDLTTFSLVGYLDLSVAEEATCLKVDGNFLYVGQQGTSTIAKIDLTTFTEVSTITLSTGGWIEELAKDDTYLYVGNYLYLGNENYVSLITRIALSTFAEVDTLTLPSEELFFEPNFVIKNNFLYIALDQTAPGKVGKVNLTTFTRVPALQLATGQDYPISIT
jgi:hypothetical protein